MLAVVRPDSEVGRFEALVRYPPNRTSGIVERQPGGHPRQYLPCPDVPTEDSRVEGQLSDVGCEVDRGFAVSQEDRGIVDRI